MPTWGSGKIPLTGESAKCSTLIIPFGQLHFNCLPLGITSAPEHFQHMMAEVIEGLGSMVCHIDDILVWGQDKEEHDAWLHTVLQRLGKARITPTVDKCELFTGSAATKNSDPQDDTDALV